MKILSFDVGIINLAYCIFDSESCKLVKWEVIEIPESSNYSKLYINLIKELDARPLLDIHVVLIEKQPSFNPKMRIIAGCLQTYFFIRGIVDAPTGILKNVEFFSPKHKLKCYTGPIITVTGKSKYAQTKKMGIAIAKIKLQEFDETIEFKTIFENSKKKDDLSDCYLQAITYSIFKKCIKNTSTVTIPENQIQKITKMGIKRGLLEYFKNNTIESINDVPEELKNQICTKYSCTFPFDNTSLDTIFGDLSLKKLLKNRCLET